MDAENRMSLQEPSVFIPTMYERLNKNVNVDKGSKQKRQDKEGRMNMD